jgi:hypothetical protein
LRVPFHSPRSKHYQQLTFPTQYITSQQPTTQPKQTLSTAMQLTLTTLAALATFTASATATIAIGTFSGNTVASIAGAADCDGAGLTVITYQGNNPCGIPFSLSNGYTYTLEGCGTSSFALYNGDGFGSYNHGCNYNYLSTACDCTSGPDGIEKCSDYLAQSWLC